MINKNVLNKFQIILMKENLKLTKQRIVVLNNIVNNDGGAIYILTILIFKS